MHKREKLGFLGFSLCSDPAFLYQIAKISKKWEVELSDGLCAIEDYLEIVETPIERLQGTFLKAMLFHLKKKYTESISLMQEILPLLKREQLTSKYNIAKEIIDSKV